MPIAGTPASGSVAQDEEFSDDVPARYRKVHLLADSIEREDLLQFSRIAFSVAICSPDSPLPGRPAYCSR
jgi:hypothetical protein